MAALSWFLVFAAVVCGNHAARIVGGDETSIEKYPSLVQVESRTVLIWSHTCAANILTSRFLLSVAHCFLLSFSAFRIRGGTTHRGADGVVMPVAEWFHHPEFNFVTKANDITVLRVETPLVYNEQIQPVGILPQGFALPDGLPVVHAGWGATEEGGSMSATLRDVTVLTVNHEICAERYRGVFRFVTENMICAGILDVGGRDACTGDSGGPMYVDGILAGLISWGNGCADPYYPGVSTSVAAYSDWIIRTAA